MHDFQGPLDGAIFAVAAMQRDEGAVIPLQCVEQLRCRIERVGIDALPCSAASTREPLFRDTSRSAEVPPNRTATLPKSDMLCSRQLFIFGHFFRLTVDAHG
jgi:hypothetical protein